MPVSEFESALNQVCAERGITKESVIESIEMALISAYRKDYGGDTDELTAKIDPLTGEALIVSEGKDVTPSGFGRIAAQTAKQVILQKIREEEKTAIAQEYEAKVGQIVTGHVFRMEGGVIIIDLGKAQGVMLPPEQIAGEHYRLNQRLKVIVLGVRDGQRGPEVMVSRADPRFVKELFSLEVPEVASGVVTIEAIAREAGSRTKMAVSSSEKNVDPVGSCVGQKGVRVQAVIAEIGEEKIDIVPYADMTEKFIASSLSPAKVTEVTLNSDRKESQVTVPDDQLSLAIGKNGQNVRLAAKMTGWKIDIRGSSGGLETSRRVVAEDELSASGLSTRVANILRRAELTSLADLRTLAEGELEQVKGLGPKAVEEVKKALSVA